MSPSQIVRSRGPDALVSLHAMRLIAAFAFAWVLVFPSPSRAAGEPGPSAYQIDVAHDGSITFLTPFKPPLRKLWSVDLGGPVSYPVLSGNLVIVTAQSPRFGTYVAALDIATGKIIWRKIVAVEFGPAYIAADAGFVFVSTDSLFEALNATNGATVWARQLQPQYLLNAMPVAANGLVYTAGQGYGSSIFALDEKTGQQEWTQLLDGGGVGAMLGDGKLYFPVPCDVPALDPTTGKVIWNYAIGCHGGGGDPGAYYGGRVYAPGANDISGVVLGAKNGQSLGALTSSVLPAFHGRTMYAISGKSLVATDIYSGNIDWFFTPKDNLSLPPIAINGFVYTRSDTGNLYIHAPGGRLAQTIAIGQGSSTLPGGSLGAGQNTVFVPSGSLLAAFAP